MVAFEEEAKASGAVDLGNANLTMGLIQGILGQVWVAWATTSHKAQGFGDGGGLGSVGEALSFDAFLQALPFLPEAVAIGEGSC